VIIIIHGKTAVQTKRKAATRKFGTRLANPTGRGTPDVINDVAQFKAPVSHLTVDYGDIYEDIAVRNGFLEIMMFGQAALAEATLANDNLELLIERLRQYISLRD
jgi:hypothetical protein